MSGWITGSRSRDQVFGRLSYFRDGFTPVTPLPEGSGVTTGTLGPQDTDGVVVRLQLSAHDLRPCRQRASDRRHPPIRGPFGHRAPGLRLVGVGFAGHSSEREISQHATDVSDQRVISSSAHRPTRHRTSVPASPRSPIPLRGSKVGTRSKRAWIGGGSA